MKSSVLRCLCAMCLSLVVCLGVAYADNIYTEWSYDGVHWTKGSSITGIKQRRVIYCRTHNETKGIYSDIVSVEVFVDMDKPTMANATAVADKKPYDTGWYDSNVTYSVSGAKDPVGKGVEVIPGKDMASGISGYLYSIYDNKTTYVNKKSMSGLVFSLPITQTGEVTCEVWCKDKAGNMSSDSKKFGVKIDKDVPTAPTINLSNSNWTNVSVTFSATGGAVGDTSGLYKYMYSFDNTTWHEVVGGLPVPVNGYTTVYVKCIDKAMHESVVASSIIKVDKSQPALCTFTVDGENVVAQWYNHPVWVTITDNGDLAYGVDSDGNEDRSKEITGGSGVKSIYYRIDGGKWEKYEKPFLCDASALVDAIAVDEAGNGTAITGAN